MGLPVWSSLLQSQAKGQDAIKIDPTAPSRSPIRRRPSGSRRIGSVNNAASGTIAHRSQGQTSRHLVDAAGRYVSDSSDQNAPLPPVPELHNYTQPDMLRHAAAFGSSMPDRLRRFESLRFGEMTRQGRDSPNGPSMQVIRAGPDGPNVYAISRDRRMADAPPQGRDVEGMDIDTLLRLELQNRQRLREARAEQGYGPERDWRESERNEFPPLRRMGHRSIADGPMSSLRTMVWSPPPLPNIDGLGDRQRSPSPADDHWETMLTTIAPDDQLPTADSSFTSAAASASFSNPTTRSTRGTSTSASTNSASSSRTHLTVPSIPSVPNDSDTPCENDDLSDTEPENLEVDSGFRPRRRTSPRRLPSHMSQRHPQDPPPRSPFRYGSDIHRRRLDARGFIRTYNSFTQRDASRDPRVQPYRTASASPMDASRDRPASASSIDAATTFRVPSTGPTSRVPSTGPETGRPNSSEGDNRPASESAMLAEIQQEISALRYLREEGGLLDDAHRSHISSRLSELSRARDRTNWTPPEPRSFFRMESTEPTPPPDVRPLPSSRGAPSPSDSLRSLQERGEQLLRDADDMVRHGEQMGMANPLEGDPDLDQMRHILERLARRDDIPEEWWMSAGLGRMMEGERGVPPEGRAARERL